MLFFFWNLCYNTLFLLCLRFFSLIVYYGREILLLISQNKQDIRRNKKLNA